MKRGVLMEENSLYGARVMGFPVDPSRSVNIDSTEDLEKVEAMLTAGSAL